MLFLERYNNPGYIFTQNEKARNLYKKTVSISDNELEDILNYFQPKTLEKDSFLIKSGQYCNSYYFVESGALKIYTQIKDKDITSWFAFEDYFFTELSSYNLKSPSSINIQALEESVVFYIVRKDMDTLLARYPNWSEFVRKNWEETFIKLEQVVLSFQAQPAEERYRELFKNPNFIQKTKQVDLASMLGITKFSLSRLRRKK